jgi:hypothetical protein
MSPKRVFRLAYHTSLSGDTRLRMHQLRDGDAFLHLLPLLIKREYEFEGLLLNLPSAGPKTAPEVDVSFLTSSDLVVLNTRPPIDDKRARVRRPVRWSYTKLENLIFAALKPRYLDFCARSQVTLPEAIARELKPGFENKADIQFHSSQDSSYLRYSGFEEKVWHKPLKSEKRTSVYLIQLPAIWSGGPGLLASFGMAGTETLIWNYLLRTRFQEWLDSYQFLIAEVLLQEIPKQPLDLSFCDNWEVTPMLYIPLSKKIPHAS